MSDNDTTGTPPPPGGEGEGQTLVERLYQKAALAKSNPHMKDFGLGLEQAAYMVREDLARQAEQERASCPVGSQYTRDDLIIFLGRLRDVTGVRHLNLNLMLQGILDQRIDAARQAERDRRHAALLDALARVVRVFSPIEAANILHTDEREALNEARQALKEAGEI